MAAETVAFELAGLPPSPNRTRRDAHWAQRAKLVREWKNDAHIAAVAARNASKFIGFPWQRVRLRLTFYLPDAKRRDPGNLVGSEATKALIDGLVSAKVIADDSTSVIVEYGPFGFIHRPREPGVYIAVDRLE